MKLKNFVYFISGIIYAINLPKSGSLLLDKSIMIAFIIAFFVMFFIKVKYPKVIIGMIAIMSAIVLFGLDPPLNGTVIQSIFPNGYEYIERLYPPTVLGFICFVLFDPKN